jgi:hypothetical protein
MLELLFVVEMAKRFYLPFLFINKGVFQTEQANIRVL